MGNVRGIFVGAPFTSAVTIDDGGKRVFEPSLRKRLEALHEAAKGAGYKLLSAHLAEDFGEVTKLGDIVKRDLEWAKECDAYVALMPSPCATAPTALTPLGLRPTKSASFA